MFFAPSNLPQDTPKVCKSKSRTLTPPQPPPPAKPSGEQLKAIHRFPSSKSRTFTPPQTPPSKTSGEQLKAIFIAFRHHNLELLPPPQPPPSKTYRGETQSDIHRFPSSAWPPPPPPSLSVILPSATALSVIPNENLHELICQTYHIFKRTCDRANKDTAGSTTSSCSASNKLRQELVKKCGDKNGTATLQANSSYLSVCAIYGASNCLRH